MSSSTAREFLSKMALQGVMDLKFEAAMTVVLGLEDRGYVFKLESTCYRGKYLVTFSKNNDSYCATGDVLNAICEAALGVIETLEGKE